MNSINPTLPFPFGHPTGLCFFKGGSAPTPSPAPPPVTERQTEVKQAQRDTKLLMRRKKGSKASILAGETGGYQPPSNQVNSSSILGG